MFRIFWESVVTHGRSPRTRIIVRISLDSVVYSFQAGQSPEAIREDFPLLKRSQIYGAIAFYLDNEAEIDRYLEYSQREFEGCGVPMSVANPALWEKSQRSRTHAGESRI